jgi:Fe-S-cluster containining protein
MVRPASLPAEGSNLTAPRSGEKKMVFKAHLRKCLIPYRDLLSTVDRLLYRIRRRYSAQIACRKGCGCGCRNLSIFPIEALSLANALQDLPAGTAAGIHKRATNASFWDCPLLEDGACNLYAFRPVICRTHGAVITSKTCPPSLMTPSLIWIISTARSGPSIHQL